MLKELWIWVLGRNQGVSSFQPVEPAFESLFEELMDGFDQLGETQGFSSRA